MRILFFMAHPGHVRGFETTLREASERGHEVIVALERSHKHSLPNSLEPLSALAAECTNLEVLVWPEDGKTEMPRVGTRLRTALDYVHYLDPSTKQSPKVRDRAGGRLPEPVRAGIEQATATGPAIRDAVAGGLRWAEQGVSASRQSRELMRDIAPDVVAVTPLVEPGSPQPEYVKQARRMGVPSALLVASWDNLTVKGRIYDPPDLVAVWNGLQAEEARSLHQIAPGHVKVVGAAPFDHWLGWAPTEDRDAFCKRVGLDPSRPYLLYTCSSKFISEEEGSSIRCWVAALREAGEPRLRDIQVMVRPHPLKELEPSSVADLDDVVVYPAVGEDPSLPSVRADYYHAIHHSTGVVGITTSAMIEGAVAGRPVFSVLSPRYTESQSALRHFNLLADPTTGFITVASTFSEHTAQLAAALDSKSDAAVRARKVRDFVWPTGSRLPVASGIVDELELLSGSAPPRQRPSPAKWAVGHTLAIGGRQLLRLRTQRARALKRRSGLNGAGPEDAERPAEEPAPQPEPEEPGAQRSKEQKAKEKAKKAKAKKTKEKERKAREKAAAQASRRPRKEKSESARAAKLITKGRSGGKVTDPAELAPLLQPVEAELRSKLQQLATRGNAVIVGPFWGEVGFELLYWIPFVRWAIANYPELEGRLTVVSRGGTRGWLTGVDVEYLDLYDLYDPAEVSDRRGALKQRTLDQFELEIFSGVKSLRGIDRADVLHPSLFYESYLRVLKIGRLGFVEAVRQSESHAEGLAAKYVRLKPPDRGVLSGRLPERYVTARFYSRPSLPDTPSNRAFAGRTIAALSEHLPVVLLNNRMELDDHLDLEPSLRNEVVTLDDLMQPSNNLEAQTIAVGNSSGFVGTYGGLAYLAPFFGLPSIGFLSETSDVHPWHGQLAERVFEGRAWGSLAIERPDEDGVDPLAVRLGLRSEAP